MRRLLSAATFGACGLFGALAVSANQDFIVFFNGTHPERLDPEQWRVTAQGDQVIAEGAATHGKLGGYILVVGHDQKVGAAEDALVRSQRRADAVKDALIRHGVPARAIATKACGYANPLVDTAQGVEAPLNRYVILWWRQSKSELAEAADRGACVPYGKLVD